MHLFPNITHHQKQKEQDSVGKTWTPEMLHPVSNMGQMKHLIFADTNKKLAQQTLQKT